MAEDMILIGICTFRRPELADTLASLCDLQPCGMEVRVAVADNDDAPSARELVAGTARDHALPIDYLHAPAGNISIARNALLDHAEALGARLFIYLDDDQTARPEWLRELVTAWRADPAGAVLGPVNAAYPPQAPAWMVRARAHDNRPVIGADGRIRAGYTGNNMIDMADPAWRGLRFDPQRGRTGGEDTAWFSDFLAAGGRIAFAPLAIIDEAVPLARAKLPWLLRRRYRMGQTHASIVARGRGPAGRALAAALAAAKAVACCAMAAARAADPARRNPQLMRAALHAGATLHLAGARPVEQYGTLPGLPGSSKGNR
ncbi:glycosyltransferase family A protein [Paracoccus rhizosphaerae]|uniref:Glycosyltransferase family A protein n=1 Tax=Paracoccus rhizosphaerae TaxID=1133347 RepID=A0ABV6CRX8_9RHOB|nr:glycosyltransferase family A protein [Paracoccus rhizosphaerae]